MSTKKITKAATPTYWSWLACTEDPKDCFFKELKHEKKYGIWGHHKPATMRRWVIDSMFTNQHLAVDEISDVKLGNVLLAPCTTSLKRHIEKSTLDSPWAGPKSCDTCKAWQLRNDGRWVDDAIGGMSHFTCALPGEKLWAYCQAPTGVELALIESDEPIREVAPDHQCLRCCRYIRRWI